MIASENGHESTVSLLLEHDAQVDYQNAVSNLMILEVDRKIYACCAFILWYLWFCLYLL